MIIKIDGSIAEEMGKNRQLAHKNGTKRYYEDENVEDIIGICGEIAFAERYQLEVDKSIRPYGDNHIDFKMIFTKGIFKGKEFTIDIKTAKKPYNLLIKEWEIDKCATLLILSKFISKNEIDLLGWDFRKNMAKQPKKIFAPKLGIVNFYKHFSELESIYKLDIIMKNSKQIIL
jgi:hypothetical protein